MRMRRRLPRPAGGVPEAADRAEPGPGAGGADGGAGRADWRVRRAGAAGSAGFQPAGLYLAMLGLFGLGLGAIIRSSVGAVAVLFGAAVRALDHHHDAA